jgi:hypothetical protein
LKGSENITGPKRTPNRIPEDFEKRIVEVRKATGFGPERIAVIVNKGLEIEGRKRISDTTCYNVLARNGLVEAEKRRRKSTDILNGKGLTSLCRQTSLTSTEFLS